MSSLEVLVCQSDVGTPWWHGPAPISSLPLTRSNLVESVSFVKVISKSALQVNTAASVAFRQREDVHVWCTCSGPRQLGVETEGSFLADE